MVYVCEVIHRMFSLNYFVDSKARESLCVHINNSNLLDIHIMFYPLLCYYYENVKKMF